jgi:hypothetical protein
MEKCDGNYLLHHENEAIRALDLEKEIQPEKAKVRARGSMQRTLEGAAMRAKLRELETLGTAAVTGEAKRAGGGGGRRRPGASGQRGYGAGSRAHRQRPRGGYGQAGL